MRGGQGRPIVARSRRSHPACTHPQPAPPRWPAQQLQHPVRQLGAPPLGRGLDGAQAPGGAAVRALRRFYVALLRPSPALQAAQASLFATLDAEAVMGQMKASPFLLAQQRKVGAPSRSDSPTRKAGAGGATPIPPTPAGAASLPPATSLVTLMSGLTLQSAGGPGGRLCAVFRAGRPQQPLLSNWNRWSPAVLPGPALHACPPSFCLRRVGVRSYAQ